MFQARDEWNNESLGDWSPQQSYFHNQVKNRPDLGKPQKKFFLGARPYVYVYVKYLFQ